MLNYKEALGITILGSEDIGSRLVDLSRLVGVLYHLQHNTAQRKWPN